VFVSGCWVDRIVMSGLLVFLGGDWNVGVLMAVMAFVFSAFACFCSINLKKCLCCPIV